MLSQRIERLKRRALEEPSPNGSWMPHGSWMSPFPDFRRTAEVCRIFAEKGAVRIAADELIVGTIPLVSRDEEEKARAKSVSEPPWEPSEEARRLERNGFVLWGGNHLVADYAEVLKKGWGGIAERIDRKLAEFTEATPEEIDLLTALRSLAGTWELWTKRHGEAAAAMARECGDPERRRELEVLAADCLEIASRPAAGFRQACRLLFFVFLLLPDSPGRLDQLLYPYFKRDMEKGVLTREEAKELLAALWIKFFEFHGKDHARSGLVHLALGGLTPDGSGGVNEVSWLCLEVAEELAIIRPQIAVRCYRGMPEDFLRRAVRLLRKNFGSPDFSNDEVIVGALIRIGIAPEDARDYCPSGCNELMIPGKSQMGALEGLFNLPKTLGCLFGLEPLPSGELLKAATPATMAEAMQLWRGVVGELVAAICRASYAVDRERARWGFGASLVTENCIDRARTIFNGGALYNFCNWDAIGLAELTDSLAAIDRAVFVDRLLTWDELRELLRSNWDGKETLRLRILREFPHFGNQTLEADAIAAQALEWVAAEFARYTPFRGGRYTLGTLAGYENAHVVFGAVTGATPDGRKAGESFAGSLGPAPGRDRSGVTAMLSSVASLPCELLPTSTVVNIRFYSGLAADDEGVARIAALITTYFAAGGPQLQITLADTATLREAQAHPERFPELMVRVAGYSAKFVSLDKAVQDEVIARTINA